jgi:hypothetical protein
VKVRTPAFWIPIAAAIGIAIGVGATLAVTQPWEDEDGPRRASVGPDLALFTPGPRATKPADNATFIAVSRETPTASLTPSAPQTFDDPFAYCAAVGTIDAPDSRWAGADIPPQVLAAMQQELGQGINPEATFWRCFEGTVLGCNIGANLPCGPANTSTEPTGAMRQHCLHFPDSGIPYAVTGHNMVHNWTCAGTEPQLTGNDYFHADERGFVAEVWYQVTP